MTQYAYVFEANSIQHYILATGKLKDCVGASEMLVMLTDSVLDAFCEQFQLTNSLAFSRRAGGAIYAFASDQAHIETLASAWPLIVRQFMPGLAFSQSIGSGLLQKDAFADARAAMQSSRNHVVINLPSISPVIALAPRTGRPATGVKRDELTDAASKLKAKNAAGKKLITRFCKQDHYHWPIDLHPQNNTDDENMNAFPFLHPGQYLAVIHIDGNSLGQRLLSLNNDVVASGEGSYVARFKRFSDAIEASSSAAATTATSEVLLPHSTRYVVPARPIVLGGDDLTVIVRADLALGFVTTFLKQFEQETKQRLSKLNLEGMTACAGIAYIKSSYPFHLAHEIADALCNDAKLYSKKIESVPSSICFSRLTNSLSDDGDATHASMGAYVLEKEKSLPAIDDLLALVGWVSEAKASSRFRALLGLAASEQHALQTDYERWRNLTKQREELDDRTYKNGCAAGTLSLNEFDKRLGNICSVSNFEISTSTNFAALSDMLTLFAVNNMRLPQPTVVLAKSDDKMEMPHA